MLEVLATLGLALPSPAAPVVSKSASAWCAQDAGQHDWKGLSLWSMDGATFRVPDSVDKRARFGDQSYASGKVVSNPQVRAVNVTAITTHLVTDMAFGQYGHNEVLYAKTPVERITEPSLTVFDRGFLCAEIFLGLTLAGEERHLLIPAKSNTKWERLSGSEKDGLVRMRVSPQGRAKAPFLPKTLDRHVVRMVSANGKERVLLTSLLDRRRYKARIWPSAIAVAGKSKPVIANSSRRCWAVR